MKRSCLASLYSLVVLVALSLRGPLCAGAESQDGATSEEVPSATTSEEADELP